MSEDNKKLFLSIPEYRLPVEARPDAMHRIKTSVIICRRSGGNVRSCGKPWNERVEDVARIDGTTSHRLTC
uniref:Uncharacterized protein n=1 Tax=Timema douglasi TaxID=61478 RepID=A0A7R8VQN7_TIMDO|nr:unnamed protein product [Timema douglasi]